MDAPNLIGSEGGGEAEAGKYWMFESGGLWYMVSVMDDSLVLVRVVEGGNC